MQNFKLTDSQIRKKFLVLQDQLLDYDIDDFRMVKYDGNDIVFSMKALVGKYTTLIYINDQFFGVGFIIQDQNIHTISNAILANESRMESINKRFKIHKMKR